MAENKKDPMEVEAVIEAINAALPLQLRSAVAYTVIAGSITGFEFQGLTAEMAAFALAELEDARHLVEKVATLEGDPAVEVAGVRSFDEPHAAVDWLVETETEAIEALQDIIPHTGQQGRSEALEHRLEHIIMRKQEQVDALLRARRG